MSALFRLSLIPMLLLLLLLSAPLLPSATAAAVITSVSGCQDSGSSTLSCTLPVSLTVRGSGFSSLVNVSSSLDSLVARVQLNSGLWTSYLEPLFLNSAMAASDTVAVFDFINPGYGVYAFGTMLTVTVYDSVTMYTTAPFLGVSVASYTPPSVSGVSGCGQATAGPSVSNCLPARDLLTVVGQGFLHWSNAWLTITLGSKQWYIYGLPDGSTDTAMLLDITSTYGSLLAASNFGSNSVPLTIVETDTARLAGAALSVRFAALPAPVFTSISTALFPNDSRSVCVKQGDALFVNCLPGFSILLFKGNYLYGLSATVNGLPMTPLSFLSVTATQACLVFPAASASLVAGRQYDIVLRTDGGSITLPSAVTFQLQPVISAGSRCTTTDVEVNAGALWCQTGNTLRLTVANMPTPRPATFVVNINSPWAGGASSSCINPRYEGANSIACELSSAPSQAAVVGDNKFVDGLSVTWSDGTTAVPNLRLCVWDYADSPRITSASGCGQQQTANLSFTAACAAESVITVYGTRFLSSLRSYSLQVAQLPQGDWYSVNSALIDCAEFAVVSDSMAWCRLPDEASLAAQGVDVAGPLQLLLTDGTVNTGRTSNELSFSLGAAHSAASSSPLNGSGTSSISRGAIAGLSVLAILVAVLAAALLAVWCRSYRSAGVGGKGRELLKTGSNHGSNGVEIA